MGSTTPLDHLLAQSPITASASDFPCYQLPGVLQELIGYAIPRVPGGRRPAPPPPPAPQRSITEQRKEAFRQGAGIPRLDQEALLAVRHHGPVAGNIGSDDR